MNKKLEEIKKIIPKDWYLDNIFSKNYFRNLENSKDKPLVIAIITNKGNWIIAEVKETETGLRLLAKTFYDKMYDKNKKRKYLDIITKRFEHDGQTVIIAPTQEIHNFDFDTRIRYYQYVFCDNWKEVHSFILHWIKVFKRAEKNNEFWWAFKY